MKQSFLFFYVPFLYTIKSRLTNYKKIISWIIIYIVPVTFSYLFLSNTVLNVYNTSLAFVGIILVYQLYEIGYIYNDTETIKNETDPTLRLSKESLCYYEKSKIKIYTVRIIFALFLSGLIYKLTNNFLFIASAWSLILIYAFYNNIRNRWNLILHFFLVCIRYCSIPLLFTSVIPATTIMFLILIFPLINTLERSREPRFNLLFFQSLIINNAGIGRYIYYALLIFLCALSIGIQVITKQIEHSTQIFLYYSIYYFTYRYFSYKYITRD